MKRESRIQFARFAARPRKNPIPNDEPITDRTPQLIKEHKIRGCCICGGINYPLFTHNGKKYAATTTKQPLVKHGEHFAHQVCLERGKHVRR